jgi:molecular chaperone Hsp33
MTDILLKGLAREVNLRFVYVDVTQTAQELNRMHGNGRVAGNVLAEALAAAALVSADAGKPDEAYSLQLNCDGAVAGFQVEAMGAGTLRGYTRKKSLKQLDRATEPPVAKVMGGSGILNVTVSTTEKVVYSGQVDASPPEVRGTVARYYNQSLQVPTGVEVVVVSDPKQVRFARAIVAQKMPDGETEVFVKVLEAFNDGRVKKHLQDYKPEADAWSVFTGIEVETTDSRPLSFGCRCSEERALASLASLTAEEIAASIDDSGSQEVTCHMCSSVYEFDEQVLLELLIQKNRPS